MTTGTSTAWSPGWAGDKTQAGVKNNFSCLATNPKVSPAHYSPIYIPSASISLITLGTSPGVGSPEWNLGVSSMDPSRAQPKPRCGQCQGVFANIQLWHSSSRSREQHPKGAQPAQHCPRAHHGDTWGLNPDLISSSSLTAEQNPV